MTLANDEVGGSSQPMLSVRGLVKHFPLKKDLLGRGAGVVREEIEREIARAEFDAAWPHTRGRRLAKTRHRVREGGLVWEVDLFRDLRAGDAPLVMAEVELSDAAERFALPAWISPLVVREVSEDARYRNSALAMYGVP
jgi:CYTH domain-containing protein